MSWKDKLLPASFRGVPFKTTDDEATFGRRVQTHEYPNRDIPYTEDLGRTVRRDKITAYVVGDDYHEQRDRLIAAINAGGVGKLVHPQYGELDVCIDGDVTVRHSSTDGRMCTISFAFVEAGELSYPTAGVATSQVLLGACDVVQQQAATTFSNSFELSGKPDFVQAGVLDDAAAMMGNVTASLDRVGSAMGSASRLLNGDLSTILMPPSSGATFTTSLQRLWRSGDSLLFDANATANKIRTLSGVTMDRGLAPRGVWRTSSKTTQARTEQSNIIAQVIRVTALAESVTAVTDLPEARLQQNGASSRPEVNSLDVQQRQQPLSYDDLTDIRNVINGAVDGELARITGDALFMALNAVRAAFNSDISRRLKQSEKTTQITPQEVMPALVLAADLYDSATREADITSRNKIIHPGFLPVERLRVPIK